MNIYQKTLVAASAIAIATVCSSNLLSPAHSNGGGAPAGRTGSPGDGANCTSCHAGTANSAFGLITSNIPFSGYIPGVSYTITAQVPAAGINEFGFEISPQNTAGTLIGTMSVTNPTDMQLISFGKYMTHKATGTAGSGSRTWSFTWVAPAAGTGDFKFYGAFVAANGNNNNGGDQVILASLAVMEDVTAGIAENILNPDSWSVYPNPATEKVAVTSQDSDNSVNEITITDITGKLIKTISHDAFTQNQSIDIADLQSGMYVLTIRSEKGIVAKKFIKN